MAGQQYHFCKVAVSKMQTRSSAEATAVRSPPPLVSCFRIGPNWILHFCFCPNGLWRPSVWGGGTKFLSEPQNGRLAVTAGCSDHKWTSHNQAAGITQKQTIGRTEISASHETNQTLTVQSSAQFIIRYPRKENRHLKSIYHPWELCNKVGPPLVLNAIYLHYASSFPVNPAPPSTLIVITDCMQQEGWAALPGCCLFLQPWLSCKKTMASLTTNTFSLWRPAVKFVSCRFDRLGLYSRGYSHEKHVLS